MLAPFKLVVGEGARLNPSRSAGILLMIGLHLSSVLFLPFKCINGTIFWNEYVHPD